MSRSSTECCAAGDGLPEGLDLLPSFAVLRRPREADPAGDPAVVADQLGTPTNRAANNLLSRRPPRFAGAGPLPVPKDADPVEAVIAAVRAMDATVLPVQGRRGRQDRRHRSRHPGAGARG